MRYAEFGVLIRRLLRACCSYFAAFYSLVELRLYLISGKMLEESRLFDVP